MFERNVSCVVLEGRVGPGRPEILLLMSHCCVLISSGLDLRNTTTSVYNYGEIGLQLPAKVRLGAGASVEPRKAPFVRHTPVLYVQGPANR